MTVSLYLTLALCNLMYKKVMNSFFLMPSYMVSLQKYNDKKTPSCLLSFVQDAVQAEKSVAAEGTETQKETT